MYGVGYPVMDRATAGGYALWFLILLAFAKMVATSLSIGIGGSGGVFAPSLFVGVTAGMAYGDLVHHLFGPGAGPPALYAVLAMGAVFTAAARAPLTSLASVVEMTGDFSLTLPVMLAVAIAAAISRAVSYGTIYTTKLLRRGTDIDRATPWRALTSLTVKDAVRPFGRPLPTEGDADGARNWAAAAGPVVAERAVPAVFGQEPVMQALRQLEADGRAGLPVLATDGQSIEGWVTSGAVLRAMARQIHGAEPAEAGDPGAALPGYRLVEVALGPDSPAGGQALGAVAWPPGCVPVCVLRDGSYTEASPGLTLRPADRVSVLAPV